MNEVEHERSNWKISQEWISCYNHWVEMELMKALKQVETSNPVVDVIKLFLEEI